MNSSVHGAYTSKGFISFERKVFPPDCFTYIIKGYPDSAKTDLFKTIIKNEKICSAQYDYSGKPRLVYCEDKNLCVKDGTYPYSAEAKTYGASDRIIDMSAFQLGSELKKQAVRVNDIMALIRKEEQRCERFLLSCAGIINDCKRLEKSNIDFKKLNRYASKLWQRYSDGMRGRAGGESKCFLTVINENGITRLDSLFSERCRDVIIINDWSGAAADMIIDRIRLYALSGGYDVISCIDILNPDDVPEHIIIPELEFGIYRRKEADTPDVKSYKRIYARRFMLKETSDSMRNRISFSKKACSDLTNEAVASVKKIRFYNDELDKIYSKEFDFLRFEKMHEKMMI
ncbi:MAG: hypothetical protein IJU45_09345 [Clostridia bacterium]|nr:hypothetical protein [Clostridia bacterium]